MRERRAVIVDALNKSIEIFTSHDEKTFKEVMANGIRPIADAVDLDRVVFYRRMDVDGDMRFGQSFLWDKAQGGLISLDDELKVLPNNSVMKRWISLMSKGGCLRIRQSDMAEDERAFLDLFGVKSIMIVPVFTHGEFWGGVSLQDHKNDSYFDEDCADLLYSAARLFVNAVIRAEMKENAEKAIETLERREKMSDTLNKASLFFLSKTDDKFDNIMTEGVRLIVDAVKVDRLSIWRNAPAVSSDGLHVSQIYRWDRDSGGTTLPTPGLEDVAYAKLAPRWEKILADNQIINSPVRLLPEAAMLNSFGVISAFISPIFHNNMFWGFVLLEDRIDERYFDENSAEMMRSAALLCTNTVLRAEMEKNIQEQGKLLKIRLEQQELLSEISRGFISSGDSETYVKEAIAKMGRYHDVSHIIIFGIDYQKNDVYPAYYWSADDKPLIIAQFDLLGMAKNSFPESLPDCATMPFISCDDIAASKNESYHALLAVDVAAFICTPIYVDGRLWGILSVEQYHTPRHWTTNEKNFVAMTASTVAGIIMRNIYNNMLKEALDKATLASKAKGDFLSNMSHEMRTPLNAIIGMTAIGRNALDIENKDYSLDKINDASIHLLGVINDVLDMSKIEANMLQLSPEEFNFEKMLQRVVNVVSFRIEEKRLTFTKSIDSQIPQTLIGDDQRLIQIITNLLGNAVKFTPEQGSINLDARFLGEEDGLCAVQISVKDSGIGISQEQQKRLFSSFEQAEASTTRKYGGTGLGLAISKSIVEMMGGKIWIESELGKGAVFIFTVKMKRGLSKLENTDEKQKPKKIDGLFAGRRILLAEDVEINREIVQTLLEPTKLKIDCAENGAEAVKMFSENPYIYDLILMDVQMPEMDGYEATRLIRAFEKEGDEKRGTPPRRIPILAMTANVFREDTEKCLKAGMDNHLGKPLDFDEVINKLRYYLPVK